MRGIYKISNFSTDKCYIGSSENIERRLKYNHLSALRKGTHWNNHLQNAWNKYGENDFTFETIEEVFTEQDLQVREQYWMDFYKSYDREFGYNIAPDAKRGAMSTETIAKIQKSRGDKYKGENSPMYGKHHTPESKEKIKKFQIGKPKNFSESHKKNIGKFFKNKTYEEIMGKEKAEFRIAMQSKSYIEKYGEEKADEMKTKLSRPYEEKYGSDKAAKIKEKMSKSHKGFKHSASTKELCRIANSGNNNYNFKRVDDDVKNQIATTYVNNNYIINNAMVKEFELTVYKMRQLLKELGIYVRKK